MQSMLAFLLLPFSWLYAAAMAVRNWLYDAGWKTSESFAVPLLNVGNLRVGGTGKTPHVAWLVEELLRQGHRPAILSRGYGRSTRGPRLATAADSATTVGDEPWQYFQQFSGAGVSVVVAEKRRLGMQLLLESHPEITVVVLDDAFQHRAVKPALNILLTELAWPFYDDAVLPAGRLRESRSGARRADVVIVTKCPSDFAATASAAVTARLRPYLRPGSPVLFSAYAYGAAKTVATGTAELAPLPFSISSPASALLLTGVAQPGPLLEYLEGQGYTIHYHARFPDHHAFQAADFAALRAHWQPGWPIFTTEKDATRLQGAHLGPALAGLPFYTIPVKVAFLNNGAAILRQLLPSVPLAGN